MNTRVWLMICLSVMLLTIAGLPLPEDGAVAEAAVLRGCVRTPGGAPPSGRTDLKDKVTYYGFLRRCADGRPAVVTIDLVEYYLGERAIREAARDGQTIEEPDVDPVVYVRNRNPKLRRLGVKPDARVLMYDCAIPGCGPRRVHLSELLWNQLYRFRLQNGLIVYIELPYTP